ncbi:MAG: phasin family protein [Neisseria sp.]|nr:phasin family protein [Neisseria sp.]
MQKLNESFSKVGLDTLAQLNKAAELALKSTEELFKLNLDFTKKSFDHNAKTAANLLKSSNPQDASKEAGEWTNQKGEQLTQHLQALYAWAESVQQNTQKLAESQLAAAQAGIKTQIEELRKSAPEQTHVLFDQMQQAFETTKNTMASLQSTAKEVQKNVAETVKQSQKAAGDAVKTAAKTASKAGN